MTFEGISRVLNIAALIREAHKKRKAVIFDGSITIITDKILPGDIIIADFISNDGLFDNLQSILTDNDIAIYIYNFINR